MTVRHLRIFVAVAETGQMSRAARLLYLTQPTVSQAIRELEEHYHTLLFERLSKRLYITEEGKRLLALARELLSRFDYLEEQMLKSREREHLRIGMTLTVGSCLVPELLRQLKGRYPKTETYTFVGNTRTIEEKLLLGELGIGIVEGQVESGDLVSIPKMKDVLVLACAADHPMAGKGDMELGELEGQRFVMREKGSGTRALFDAYLEREGLSICNCLETDSVDIIRNAVLHDGCMAVVSERLLRPQIERGELYVFYREDRGWERSFSLVYHKDKYMTPSMQALGELLEQFGGEAGPYMEEAGVIRCGV